MMLSQYYPTIKPTLNLDFTRMAGLDPRVTFTRASTATYFDGSLVRGDENLIRQSKSLSSANVGYVNNAVLTPNAWLSPNNKINASRVDYGGIGDTNVFRMYYYATPGYFVYSIYLKAANATSCTLVANELFAPNHASVAVNLSAVTVTASGAAVGETITSVGDGWYRVSFLTLLANDSPNSTSSYLEVRSSAGSTIGEEKLYVYGPQVEGGLQRTGYTETDGEAIRRTISQLKSAPINTARLTVDPNTIEPQGLLIEESRSNICLRSQELSNSYWVKTNCTVIADACIAPDGTYTADKVVPNSTNGAHYIQSGTLTDTNTFTLSFFAKAAEYWLLLVSYSPTINMQANLKTGTITSVGANVTSSSIKPIGSGWYYCTMSVSKIGALTLSPAFYVYNFDIAPSNNYAGYADAGLYIWGVQHESNATFPTSYIPTTSASATRAADVASMTGANFTSWYRPDEGTLYAEGKSSYITGAGSGFVSLNNGTLSKRIELYAGSESHLYIVDNGQVQVNMDLGSFTKDAFSKVAAAYAVNNFGGSLDSSIVSDTLGTVPTVDKLVIGDFALLTVKLNGTIRKIAYYPARLTNEQLQALTI